MKSILDGALSGAKFIEERYAVQQTPAKDRYAVQQTPAEERYAVQQFIHKGISYNANVLFKEEL